MQSFTPGIWVLVLGYTLSQFYRAFMAVLSPVLRVEIGAEPGDLAISSGIWFFAFAGMQVLVGSWLDRYGPRRTASGLMLVAALGAVVFALATAPWHLHVAMALIGIGCSPALMSAYYIFARNYTLREFGTLAGEGQKAKATVAQNEVIELAKEKIADTVSFYRFTIIIAL